MLQILDNDGFSLKRALEINPAFLDVEHGDGDGGRDAAAAADVAAATAVAAAAAPVDAAEAARPAAPTAAADAAAAAGAASPGRIAPHAGLGAAAATEPARSGHAALTAAPPAAESPSAAAAAPTRPREGVASADVTAAALRAVPRRRTGATVINAAGATGVTEAARTPVDTESEPGSPSALRPPRRRHMHDISRMKSVCARTHGYLDNHLFNMFMRDLLVVRSWPHALSRTFKCTA